MAFKLSKKEITRKNALEAALRSSGDALETMLESFNEFFLAWESEATAAIDTHNEARAEAAEWLTDLANDRRAAFDEKSERWREGEAAEAADAWISSIEDAANGLDELSFEIPEAFEVPDFSEAPALLDELDGGAAP